jgi:DNA processing protein
VFAIPGSIHNPMAKGCNRLIGQGAKLVQDVADICEELEDLMQQAALNRPGLQASSSQALPKELARVLAAIGHDPVTVDVLLPETGMTVEKITALLAELEMAGLVRRGQRGYSRTLPD